MSTRSRKEALHYRKYLRKSGKDECPFCDFNKKSPDFVKESNAFLVIRNLFPYSVWDTQPVEDHLMVIPKRHINSLHALSAEQSKDFLNLISSFESQGYNVYARSPQSEIKTVVHQHTHLIKLGGKPKKLILYIRKPFYFRIPR